ncbi:MAG TPA: GNAT family N-acetyltransferase [Blastocatellia bacterium]|nr:GNAT family N-acetyltransferase [Blastocatellia bacterium]
MELKVKGYTIRDWRAGDEESLLHHANNRKVWRNLRDAFPHPYTMADAKSWIETASTASPVTSFAIEVDGEAVGGIGFTLRDDVFRVSAEIGYWLGEEYWGRGIATEAVRAMTDYVFANYDIHRVWAGVFEWNPGSMRVLEKAGFKFEGRMKKSVIKEGQIIDEMIYAIWRDKR